MGMTMKDISQTTIKSKDDSCFKHEKKTNSHRKKEEEENR